MISSKYILLFLFLIGNTFSALHCDTEQNLEIFSKKIADFMYRPSDSDPSHIGVVAGGIIFLGTGLYTMNRGIKVAFGSHTGHSSITQHLKNGCKRMGGVLLIGAGAGLTIGGCTAILCSKEILTEVSKMIAKAK